MTESLDRTFGGTLLRGHLHLPVAITPATARPPLTVAYGPEEVPPWDWTRGRPPWSYLPLGPEPPFGKPKGFLASTYEPQPPSRLGFRLSAPTLLVAHYLGDEPFGPRVEQSYLDFLAPPGGPIDRVPEGGGGQPVPPLVYPRLVRKHAFFEAPPDLDFPLYREVAHLGKLALRHPPTSPVFIRKTLQVAQKVGLLDPYGLGDSIPVWHAFALEVRAHLDFLKEFKVAPSLAVESFTYILDDLRMRAGFTPGGDGGWHYRGQKEREDGALAYYHALNFIQRGVAEGGTQAVSEHLWALAWHTVLARADWGLAQSLKSLGRPGPVYVRCGVREWVFLELAALYSSRSLQFCPVCGAPFLGRKGQKTCGADRCRKALKRKEAKGPSSLNE